MKHAYITYDPKYMESVWFILKQAWEKKLLFKDYKVVPYCPRCGTTLSSHEVAQGYQKVKDPSIYVKFRVINPEMKNTSLLVWTTTPWTLPANVAAAVNPKMDYVKVRAKEGGSELLILAKSRIAALGDGFEVVEEMKGDKLVGLRYQAAYPASDEARTIYKVIPANFVSLEDGSGIVHIAPAFGAEDMETIRTQNKELCSRNLPEFPVILNVGEDGAFTFDTAKWSGMFVKDADPLIIKDLEERGLLFKTEPYEHDYPFCWRCKTPLLYYAKLSWFIEMTKLRARLLENNEKINWVPAHLKKGRFGEWLAEVEGLGDIARTLLGYAAAGVGVRVRKCRGDRFCWRPVEPALFAKQIFHFPSRPLGAPGEKNFQLLARNQPVAAHRDRQKTGRRQRQKAGRPEDRPDNVVGSFADKRNRQDHRPGNGSKDCLR